MSVSKNLWFGDSGWLWLLVKSSADNAIFSAKTPVMDALWANRPHTLIDASGLEVGLPDRQMATPRRPR